MQKGREGGAALMRADSAAAGDGERRADAEQRQHDNPCDA
jgi:hypothetical protein